MNTINRDRFKTPVKLTLKSVPAEIWTLEEFDRAIVAKMQITTQLFAKLSSLDDETLFKLTLSTRKASDKLQAGLRAAVDQPARVKSLLLDLGPTFFTEDHEWRKLFSEIVTLPPDRNELKLIALTRYHRYLTARLDALNTVGCNRIQSKICGHAHSVTEDVTQFGDHPGVTRELSSSETIVRDVVRLPKGKTAPIRAEDQACVDIWLAKRRFRIEMWDQASLIDSHGNSIVLKEGRNSVGRALFNDVIIDPSFNEVSRSHMIVDMSGGRPVGITDLSSGGTFLSKTLVAA